MSAINALGKANTCAPYGPADYVCDLLDKQSPPIDFIAGSKWGSGRNPKIRILVRKSEDPDR